MSNFIRAITDNWPNHVISPGAACSCDVCLFAFGLEDETDKDWAQEQMYNGDEGHFSWAPCDSCGSKLGGDRHCAHAIHNEAFGPDAKRPDDVLHIEICTDCLLFHANGDEPDEWHPEFDE